MNTVTDDKEAVTSFLDNRFFSPYEPSWLYWGIDQGFSVFEATDDSILKIMVVLSDGEINVADNYQSVITKANDNNVRIYTVGFGENTECHDKYLKLLSEKTSGKFYTASDADRLAEIYDDVSQKIDLKTDSDNDGLPDYYEDNLPLFNGLTIKLDKNDADSDDDGLDDGEEVELKYYYDYNGDKTKVLVIGKFLSNPKLADSDRDGLDDIDELYVYDTEPLIKDTDKDGLNDGTEVENWFDPLVGDYDKDGRPDLKEYEKGTSPYVYNTCWV